MQATCFGGPITRSSSALASPASGSMTFGTPPPPLLLEAGAHPRVVAERLGHASPSLVMNIYGHVTERMQTEATATLERVLSA